VKALRRALVESVHWVHGHGISRSLRDTISNTV
jgi:hypothetical protein